MHLLAGMDTKQSFVFKAHIAALFIDKPTRTAMFAVVRWRALELVSHGTKEEKLEEIGQKQNITLLETLTTLTR